MKSPDGLLGGFRHRRAQPEGPVTELIQPRQPVAGGAQFAE